jgi:deazaflavin-dependent oxidoreductase (nitroreductase family)
MVKQVKQLKPPQGLARIAFRLPIWFYRVGLGGLLGTRFLLLTHIGRQSGQERRTVLEVVRYDRASGACIVASGWGGRSDWVYNITANPNITYQVGKRSTPGIAERLSAEAAAQEMLDYSHRYPLAFRELAAFMGFQLDGTEEDIRAMGRLLPMFLFRPQKEIE